MTPLLSALEGAHAHAHTAAGAAAFFALGLAAGIHCLGMCGPLACLLGRPERTPFASLGLYHGARMTAYAAVGAAFASIGAPLRPVVSWPVVAAIGTLPLLWYALRPAANAPLFLGRWHGAGARRLRGLPPPARALGLGILTPLLPCGMLYAAAGAAAAAPNVPAGAAWMAAFAAGTLPLLVLGQAGFTWAARAGRGAWVPTVRRGAALLAAATLIAFAVMGTM